MWEGKRSRDVTVLHPIVPTEVCKVRYVARLDIGFTPWDETSKDINILQEGRQDHKYMIITMTP